MAKQKYIFNHKTLRFEKFQLSRSKRIGRAVLVFLSLAGVAFLFAILLFTFFKSPKEKAQARELEFMKLKYEMLNDRLDDIEALVTDMEQRDNDIYRVMFEADPIPSSVRRSGFSDADRYADMYGYMNSDLVVNSARKMDVIASQLYNQSVSYDSLFVMARNKSAMLTHIPAIFPLKEDEITYISSYFGYRPDPIYKVEKFHSGIDFSAALGTEAYATGDGVVADVESNDWGYGNMVTIDHGFGYKTRYAHLQEIKVTAGQVVIRGDRIGTLGSSGLSTGPHLHYEVIYRGTQINPWNFLNPDVTPEEYNKMVRGNG